MQSKYSSAIALQLAERRAAAYSKEDEERVQNWIEAVTGVSFPTNFADSLKDGVILCKYGRITFTLSLGLRTPLPTVHSDSQTKFPLAFVKATSRRQPCLS